jgi:hypothetical protein
MIQFSHSMQPLLIGSVVLLSLACRDDRSSPSDTTTPSTTARSSQPSTPPSSGIEQRPNSPELGRNQIDREQMDREQMNRDDMSGTQPRMDERMPVAGRDDAIELGNGGGGGKSGAGGSHH